MHFFYTNLPNIYSRYLNRAHTPSERLPTARVTKISVRDTKLSSFFFFFVRPATSYCALLYLCVSYVHIMRCVRPPLDSHYRYYYYFYCSIFRIPRRRSSTIYRRPGRDSARRKKCVRFFFSLRPPWHKNRTYFYTQRREEWSIAVAAAVAVHRACTGIHIYVHTHTLYHNNITLPPTEQPINPCARIILRAFVSFV